MGQIEDYYMDTIENTIRKLQEMKEDMEKGLERAQKGESLLYCAEYHGKEKEGQRICQIRTNLREAIKRAVEIEPRIKNIDEIKLFATVDEGLIGMRVELPQKLWQNVFLEMYM